MIQYDPMKLLKINRPRLSVLPFLMLIMVLLVTYGIFIPRFRCSYGAVKLPDAIFAGYIAGDLPIVILRTNGSVYFDDKWVDSLEQLPILIKSSIHRRKLKEAKVALHVDNNAGFGLVQHVLTWIQRAGVHNIALITQLDANLLDFFIMEKLNVKRITGKRHDDFAEFP